MFRPLFFVSILLLSAAGFGQTTADAKKINAAPQPSITDGRYGPFERNTFDLWKPRSKRPTPLVVYIHGGGFNSGNKEKISANLLNKLLENGIAVMSINYRLLPGTHFPDIYMDCVRAIQFARYNAGHWNIDKGKIAASGSSAGGLTALWIGFHDDLADRGDPDPVRRESSRLSAMVVYSAQTTLVPEIVRSRVGDTILKHSFLKGAFFGIKPDEAATAAGHKLFVAASPMTYLTSDDPPVWAFYSVPDRPLTADSTVSDAVHHPAFGAVLKEAMDKLHIECRLRHKDDGQNVLGDVVQFLKRQFKQNGNTRAGF